MAMQVSKIDVSCYGSAPSGTINISGDGNFIQVTLEELEAHQLFALALRIFEGRQAKIAQAVADMKPRSLAAPNIPEAELAEAQDNNDDDVPF